MKYKYALEALWYILVIVIGCVMIEMYLLATGPTKSIIVNENLRGEWGMELVMFVYVVVYGLYKLSTFLIGIAND